MRKTAIADKRVERRWANEVAVARPHRPAQMEIESAGSLKRHKAHNTQTQFTEQKNGINVCLSVSLFVGRYLWLYSPYLHDSVRTFLYGCEWSA